MINLYDLLLFDTPENRTVVESTSRLKGAQGNNASLIVVLILSPAFAVAGNGLCKYQASLRTLELFSSPVLPVPCDFCRDNSLREYIPRKNELKELCRYKRFRRLAVVRGPSNGDNLSYCKSIVEMRACIYYPL